MPLLNNTKFDISLKNSLAHLNNENRMIATPWSRIVRGLGLGQYPIEYSDRISIWIQDAFGELKIKTGAKNNYVNFSSLLCDFICLLIASKRVLSNDDKLSYIKNIFFLIDDEFNPYRRIMQYCIAIDALAKLNINLFDFTRNSIELSELLFKTISEIKSNRINDENMGKHGDYEKLSAYTSVFFALAVCNKADVAVTAERNHITDALETLAKVPSPFFRGRGGGMLFSAIKLLGYGSMLQAPRRDYLFETLDFIDSTDEIGSNPVFPQEMTPEFVKIYPLLTMLNSIAVTGHLQALKYRQDRIQQVNLLMDALTPVERTHMGLYYIIAIYNLGLLESEKKRVNALVDELVHTANHIDPSENYFLHGIACSYVIETAVLVGRRDLITERIINALSESFFSMNRCLEDEINRPYPFSYALTMLSEIGHTDRLFEPSASYENKSAIGWIIDNITQVEDGADGRLYMLNHALINLMLRMRSNKFPDLRIYSNFVFPAA